MACKYKSKVWFSGWCDVACVYCTLTQERNCEHNKKTNADRIRSMSDEELEKFISVIAYGRETPWSNLFEEKCCKNCPVTKCEIYDYLNPMFLHECDFHDGKCHYGSDIEWWLQQPAE